MTKHFEWTEERAEQLKTLLASDINLTEIARRLGATYRQVRGRVYRHGLHRLPKSAPEFVYEPPVPLPIPEVMNGGETLGDCPGPGYHLECPGRLISRRGVGGYIIEDWVCACNQERTWTKVR